MWPASYSVLESASSSCAALICAEKPLTGMFMALHMIDMWRQKTCMSLNIDLKRH